MSLEQQLKSGIARVNFTKVNGAQRSMLCTLLPGYIPAEEVVEPSEPTPGRARSSTTLSVWDIENDGWRSFRLSSINSIDYPVADVRR